MTGNRVPTERFDKAFLAGSAHLDLRTFSRTGWVSLAICKVMGACDGRTTHGLFGTGGVIGANLDLARTCGARRLGFALVHGLLAENHLSAGDNALAGVGLTALALWDLHLTGLAGWNRATISRRHLAGDRVAADALLEALAISAALLDLL